MSNIELEVRPRDWLYILMIGITFGTLLSMLGYQMLQLPPSDGIILGALFGFSITLFALVFITFMNRKVLPHIRKRFWVPMAILFSFLAGFLGTLTSLEIAHYIHISKADFLVTMPLQIATAIGALTYLVGVLLYRFVRMRNEKEIVAQHYLHSRLRSLDTQLNPHFLFNALNSVAELIHQNPDKAEDAILKISSFLRNSMKEEALIPLEEELHNATEYIELENIRYSGTIIVTLPTGQHKRIMVPKFSIQLLVENAIKHGKRRTVPLHISITLNQQEGIIHVQNDGVPLQSEAFGIGLKNLDERLQLLCSGSLQVTSQSPVVYTLHLGACHENTHRR